MTSRGKRVSLFFFSSRRRHTRYIGDWSSDVCSSDLAYPAEEISLRTAARDNVVIIDEGERAQPRVIGEVDAFSAPMLVHTDAVYIHEGQIGRASCREIGDIELLSVCVREP